MARAIYLSFDEEVISALQKIRRAGADEVVLVVPKGARLLRNLTTLKLLADQSQKFKKDVSIATADERGKVLAQRAGLKIAAIPAKEPLVQALHGKPGGKPIGDIRFRKPAPATVPESQPAEKHPTRVLSEARPAKHAGDDLSHLIGPGIEPHSIVMPEKVKIGFRHYRKIIFSAVALIAIVGVLGFYVLPTAEVTVIPRSEAITRDLEILVDSQISIPDIQDLSIPGKKTSEELSDSQTYPANGVKNVGEKASGFVTLYNFSKTTLILKKNTTRLEANGKTYYFLQDVGSIRPTARIGSDLEVDPTSLIDPVPIVAADSGETFNLPAGTRFEIYNEVFGHQPDVLYAVNGNPIAGGTNKQIKIVSDADVQAARLELDKTLVEKMKEGLKSKLTPSSRLADNAYTIQSLEEMVTPAVGTEATEFTLTRKIQINSLLYDEADVRDLIVQRIVRLLPENQFLLPEEEQRLSAQYVSLDLNAGSGTLRTHFESQVRYKMSPDFISKSILGRSATQVKEILLARPEVEDVSVKFWPGWVRSVPRFSSKVNLIVVQ